MKPLLSPETAAAWDNRWVQDIGFIRRHLRFPVSRLTVLPVVLAAMGVALFCFLIYLAITWQEQTRHRNIAPLVGMGVMSLSGLVTGYRHLQLLRFIEVPAPFFSTGNQDLLIRFFRSQCLAFGRHPEVPEVFQIISQPIERGKDDREVMIFLADDHRILINSHFTDRGWVARVGHQKEMAGTLRKWIAGQPGTAGTTPARRHPVPGS